MKLLSKLTHDPTSIKDTSKWLSKACTETMKEDQAPRYAAMGMDTSASGRHRNSDSWGDASRGDRPETTRTWTDDRPKPWDEHTSSSGYRQWGTDRDEGRESISGSPWGQSGGWNNRDSGWSTGSGGWSGSSGGWSSNNDSRGWRDYSGGSHDSRDYDSHRRGWN
jgi:hypothetical protein